MIKYIIIENSLVTALQKSAMKGFSRDIRGKYIQDNENTMVSDLKFLNDNKTYSILSWDETFGKPPDVLPRYSESGKNEKVNKIMTEEEIRNYIHENIEPVGI